MQTVWRRRFKTGRLQRAPPWESRTPAPILGTLLVCKPRLDCHRAVAAAPCENVRFEFVAAIHRTFFTSRSKKNLRPIPRLLEITSLSAKIADMLGWWNWQTRTFEGRMPKGVRVQVPSRVPCGTTGRKAAWIEDSRGLCIGDGFEQRPGEGEEADNCPHNRLRTVA